MLNYLAHHGILGQKWGVRRYRNKDGTRTAEGKARRRQEYKDTRPVEERALDRYSGPLNAADAKWVSQRNQQLRKAGIKTGSDGDDRISAGSKMTRFTTNPSETNDRPRYVSLAKVDRTAYRKMADDGALGGKKEEPVYEMTLTAVDDLRVANGKAVADYIVERYGDDSLKSKWTTYNAMKIPDNYDRIFKDMTRNKNRKDVGQYAFQLRRDVFDGLQRALYTNKGTQQEILDYYTQKGYDAIVDAEDWAGGFTYPVIVMNTSKIKTTHVNRRKKSK